MSTAEKVKQHLIHEAYESLLRRADTYDEKDWESAQRFERHAINAALDLREARKSNAELLDTAEATLCVLRAALDELARNRYPEPFLEQFRLAISANEAAIRKAHGEQ